MLIPKYNEKNPCPACKGTNITMLGVRWCNDCDNAIAQLYMYHKVKEVETIIDLLVAASAEIDWNVGTDLHEAIELATKYQKVMF